MKNGKKPVPEKRLYHSKKEGSMKKKVLFGILFTVLLVTIAGCKKQRTAGEILEDMKKALKTYQSIEIHLYGNLEGSVLSETVSNNIKADFDYILKSDLKISNGYSIALEGSCNQNCNGSREAFFHKHYLREETDQIRFYTFHEEDRSWTYQEQPGKKEELASRLKKDWKGESFVLREETIVQDGKMCYILDGSLSGKELWNFLFPIFSETGEHADWNVIGTADPYPKQLEKVNVPIDSTWYIDQKTMLPYKIELNVTDFLKEFEKGLLPAKENDEASDRMDEYKIQNTKWNLSIVFQKFNKTPVSIPDEVVSHASKEQAFSIDFHDFEMDETDPLYALPEESQKQPVQRPTQSSYDISEEEFRKALEELERIDWEWE